MSRILERIPKEQFQDIFRPVIRFFGSRELIIRMNEAAKTAIPRQTKLDQLMSKLEILCYEQNRPRVEEELEQLWNLYFENRLQDARERFGELSDELNKNLDGEHLPQEPEKLQTVKKAMQEIVALLGANDFSEMELDSVFRIKAYPDVLDLYMAEKSAFLSPAQEKTEGEP